MKISAVACWFMRNAYSPREYGIAILRDAEDHYGVISILPETATSTDDVVKDVWDYSLCFASGCMTPHRIPGQPEKETST